MPPKPAQGASEDVKVESAPGFGNQRLTSEQEDQLYQELAGVLTGESIYQLGQRFLGMIKDQESLALQQALGETSMSMQRYEEALKSFEWILQKDESSLACICSIGHCHFLAGRLPDAEKAYIQALRVASFSGQALEDPLVLQRLGSIYVQQQLYEEAAVIFEQCIGK